MKRILGSAAVVAMAAAMFGCSIHTQAPIKEVAYDFSDYKEYDRSFAASPDYNAPAPMAAADEAPAPCPLAGSCQTGSCGGCNRTYVEVHHYYEDSDGDDRPAPRHRPRAEADRDDGARQAERPARPRVHIDVEADEQAPAARAEIPAGSGGTRQAAPASAPPSAQRPDAPAIGSSGRRASADVRRVQVDIH